MKIFNPARLTQARNWNNYTLDYLAGMLGVTKASVSLYEKGARNPDAFVQIRLAEALGFPIEFFYKPSFDTSNARISYRKNSSTKKKEKQRAELLKQFSIEFIAMLSGYVSFKESTIKPIDISCEELSSEDIEDVAVTLRKTFNAGLGPIQNLMIFLENRGAIIFLYDNSIIEIDGFSCMYASQPFIYINTDYPWDRMRFTLAHELGHIILHSGIDETKTQSFDFYKMIERQANVFAGAFLFPKESFRREFRGIDNRFLLETKKKWGLSKAAIVKRAHSLKLIGDTQKISFFTGQSRRKERKEEEGSKIREKEAPFLVKTVVNTLLEQHIDSYSLLEQRIDSYSLISRCGFPDELLQIISANTLVAKDEEKQTLPFKLNF